jgi:hypothetical protein
MLSIFFYANKYYLLRETKTNNKFEGHKPHQEKEKIKKYQAKNNVNQNKKLRSRVKIKKIQRHHI